MKRFAVLAVMLLSVLATNAQMQTEIDKFRATYESDLKRSGVVGSSFAIVANGKVTRFNFGSANIAKSQAVDDDTIWHWASNTKPFTGIAIMQLRDRGLLKLDDAVTKYLPELRKVHNSHGSMDDITIRQLMTHSAGFRGGTWPWGSGADWEPFEPTEYSQLVAMFPYTEIRFKPGSKFSYSNPGIIFLGKIIEKLSGEDYEVYIDKNIFRPLEMTRSYFDTTPPHLLKHRSHSYYIKDGKRTEGRFDADTGITVSNSGLNSPMGDMLKYVQFLIGVRTESDSDRALSAKYNLVLKRPSLEEMWKPQLPVEVDANGNRGFTTDIGLIYFLDTTLGKRHFGHGGDQNGFISYIDVDPDKALATIIVFNTDIYNAGNAPTETNVVASLRRLVRAFFK